VLDPQQAAGMSESQGAIDAKASYKERPISAAPTKAAHLHDKTARNALKRLETRFHTSATTIAPAPGTDTTNWPLHNYALKSRSGRSRVNKTGDSDGNTPQLPSLDIRVHSAHGGRQGFELMLEHALLSGEFDNVLSRVNQLRNESSEISIQLQHQFCW